MAGEAGEDVQPAERSDWVDRPWAATFDLIASEYGWTDEQILDLTLARMRQIREVVLRRRDAEFRKTVRLEEIKVRHLVSATFAAARNKKGAQQAASIEFMERDETEKKRTVPTIRQISRMFPVDSNPQYGMLDMGEVERRAALIRAERAGAEMQAVGA